MTRTDHFNQIISHLTENGDSEDTDPALALARFARRLASDLIETEALLIAETKARRYAESLAAE